MKSINKVIFVLFMFIAFMIFTTNAIAGSWHSTDYDVGATYTAGGSQFATGGSETVVKPEKSSTINFSGQNFEVNGVYNCQKVESNAWAIGRRSSTHVFGAAIQHSGARAEAPKNNWAYGDEISEAYYNGKSKGCGYIYSKGYARACGGSIAGAANFTNGNTNIGMAGSAVGSCGKAAVVANKHKTVGILAEGYTAHHSYASRGNGEAWTYGTASYNYHKKNHACYISGGGFAATGGISTVTTRPNGAIVAQSHSISMSSSGHAYTEGGSYISSFH